MKLNQFVVRQHELLGEIVIERREVGRDTGRLEIGDLG
jgi:hypothetical protein